jgi:hypothetical protein
MTTACEYIQGAELPPLLVQFLANDGTTVIDLTGYSCVLKLATDPYTTPVLSKSSGITASANGATVNFAAGELDVDPGIYVFELTASSGGLDYRRQGSITILPKLA